MGKNALHAPIVPNPGERAKDTIKRVLPASSIQALGVQVMPFTIPNLSVLQSTQIFLETLNRSCILTRRRKPFPMDIIA